MQLVIGAATQADLHRLRELVARPNQLCVTYTDEELERLRCSPSHACLLVSLRDRFGDCGQVGLVLMDLAKDRWTLQLFLFSCRVVRRGVDAIVLSFILRQARAARVRLFAHFKRTSKNAPLLEAYLRAGFKPGPTLADLMILEHELKKIPAQPRGVQLSFECPPQMVERGGPRRLIHAR
jgi:FkbH-like protein